jgi:hypothetical protein
VSRLDLADEAPSLEEVGVILRAFLLPCVSEASLTKSDLRHWIPSRQWDGGKDV